MACGIGGASGARLWARRETQESATARGYLELWEPIGHRGEHVDVDEKGEGERQHGAWVWVGHLIRSLRGCRMLLRLGVKW